MMYAAKFVIVYLDEKTNEYVMIETAKNDEGYALTLLNHKGKHQKLKNIFKINYKGEVTKFQDLQLGPALRNRIKELTGK